MLWQRNSSIIKLAKSVIYSQLTVVLPKNVTIGSGCTIMDGVLMMGAGGITIGNNVLIGAHAKLISNNHDIYDRVVLTVKPVEIKDGAWIGAGATVLPGVTIGKYAILGADSVATKDIPDYAVAVGSPAKVIKYLIKINLNKQNFTFMVSYYGILEFKINMYLNMFK